MRAAQREFTRSRLVDAAIEVFAQRGYAQATINEIALRAGATRATFYLHFKSKSEVLPELVDRGREHFHRIYEELSPVVADPSFEGVRNWLAGAMREWEAVRDFAAPVFAASILEPGSRPGSSILDLDVHTVELAGALRAGAPSLSAQDAEVYANVLLAPLTHYFQVYLRGEEFDYRRVLDVVAEAWMAVISLTRSSRPETAAASRA